MHNVSLEESRNNVPVDTAGGIFVYRLHTDFSEFVMHVVAHSGTPVAPMYDPCPKRGS